MDLPARVPPPSHILAANQIITPGKAPGLNNLLSLNATDFTKAVNRGLTCAFVYRPSSGGAFEGKEIVPSDPEGFVGEELLAFPDRLQAHRITASIQGREQGGAGTGIGAPGLHTAIRYLHHEFLNFPYREAGWRTRDELAHERVPVFGGPPARPRMAKESRAR